MSEWKYRTIHLSDLPRKTGEIDLLNGAGAEGWELVGITSNNIAYLKRQVSSSGRPPVRPPRRKPTSDNGE
jgi:hypothetical protein